MRTRFSNEEHDRIAGAIRKAESSTSGEIYCVLATRSDNYFFPAAFFSMLAILISMTVTAWIIDRNWADLPHLLLPGAGFAAGMMALLMLAFFPWIRIWFVPRRLRYQRASANAVRQFLSRNIHLTSERTGVLIFVSLQEKYAEIVADSGINSLVPQERWNEIIGILVHNAKCGALADGFVAAIDAAGIILAEHFPPEEGRPNQLEDRLAEI